MVYQIALRMGALTRNERQKTDARILLGHSQQLNKSFRRSIGGVQQTQGKKVRLYGGKPQKYIKRKKAKHTTTQNFCRSI